MNIAGMTIHIPQDLHPDNQERLEGELRQPEDVSAARFNSRIKKKKQRPCASTEPTHQLMTRGQRLCTASSISGSMVTT